MVKRSAAVVLWGVLSAGPARAQQVPVPAPPAETERAVSPDVFRDLARLEALLPAFAAQARTQRLAVGGIFIATGLAAVPVGIVAQASWHQDYGVGLWVGGALFLGFGTLSLLWQTPLETLAYDFQGTAGRLAPAERLAFGAGGLASVAAGARSGRKVGAVIDFDGGGRYRGEMTDVDPDAVSVGTRVTMTFRRLYSAQGVHNYFWKARPLPDTAPGAAGRGEGEPRT